MKLKITMWFKVNGAGSFQMQNPNLRTRKWIKIA